MNRQLQQQEANTDVDDTTVRQMLSQEELLPPGFADPRELYAGSVFKDNCDNDENKRAEN